MLRKLCSFDKWGKLSTLKLREELAKRGLKRTGFKDELVQRLKQNEHTEKLEVVKLEPEEDLGQSSLNNLTKPYILQEILKRKPDYQIPSRFTKSQLIESLSSIILEEKTNTISDLKTLLLKSSNLGQITLQEILLVFEGLKDPYQMSQFDMNVLVNTDALCMIPI